MALSLLDQLYRSLILDHSANPHHFGQLDHKTHEMQLLNPTCGDAVTVEIKVNDQDRIEAIAFNGQGCTISIASASLMTDLMVDKTVPEALDRVKAFTQLVGGATDSSTEEYSPDQIKDLLGDCAILAGVKQFPARYKCAILSWRALEFGLKEDSQDTLLDQDGITRKEV